MLKIISTESDVQVHIVGGGSFSLPTPSDLKSMLLNHIKRSNSVAPTQLASIVERCEFQYEIATAPEEVLGLVVTTAKDVAIILRDLHHPLAEELWTSVADVCPDIGTERVVIKGRSAKPPRRPAEPKQRSQKSKSPADEQFVHRFVEGLVNQGRLATAFGEAARWGSLTLVQRFIDEGQPVDGVTESGCTPLMLAASAGNQAIVEFLIAAGSNVNAVDEPRGMSPILWSLASGNKEQVCYAIVSTLMQAGADPTIASKEGLTAVQLSRQRKSRKLVELIAPDR